MHLVSYRISKRWTFFSILPPLTNTSDTDFLFPQMGVETMYTVEVCFSLLFWSTRFGGFEGFGTEGNSRKQGRGGIDMMGWDGMEMEMVRMCRGKAD